MEKKKKKRNNPQAHTFVTLIDIREWALFLNEQYPSQIRLHPLPHNATS